MPSDNKKVIPVHLKLLKVCRANTIQPARLVKRIARCESTRASKFNSKSGRVHKIRSSAPPASTREVPDNDSPSKKIAVHAAQENVQTGLAEGEWYIEYQRPPATSIRPVGLSFQSLGERLGLDEDTVTRTVSPACRYADKIGR